MNLAPIVLVVVSGQAPVADEHLAALVQACSSALRVGSCSADPNANPGAADIRASVGTADGLHFELRLELPPRADRPRVVARSVDFRTSDEERERWRSVGLAVANLAGDGTNPTPSAAPAPTHAEAQKALSLSPVRLDFGLATGPGSSGGPFRIGGWLGLGLRHPRLPLYAFGLGRYAFARAGASDIQLNWLTLAAGLGVLPPITEAVELRIRVGAAAERLAASLDFTGGSSHDARWVFGALGGLDLVWPRRGFAAALISLEAAGFTGGTAINLNGGTTTSSPALELMSSLGLELRL